jgi:hypothetical protein
MYKNKDNSINEGSKDVFDGKENFYTDKNKGLDDTEMLTIPCNIFMIIERVIERPVRMSSAVTKGLW